ncbi:MAG: hypothetical protein KBC64_06720 [Simkaniaceae bacterium]|nr:hypothetical protein [Simkaniaceae bacterium]
MNRFAEHYFEDMGAKLLSDEQDSRAPQGWKELMHLKPSDRIEFVRDFWLATLPYTPHISDFFHTFFASLDEISVYVVGERVMMVYSLDDNATFFIGDPPFNGKVETEAIFPEGYLQFFKIHNGFRKVHDTGLIPAEALKTTTGAFRDKVGTLLIKRHDELVDPATLFPFYRSFDTESYQCFYSQYYADGEMGNVYCSLEERTLSESFHSADLSFPTFEDWLIFYLEIIE